MAHGAAYNGRREFDREPHGARCGRFTAAQLKILIMEANIMHPLNSVKGAITTGVVLAIIIGIGLGHWAGVQPAFHPIRIDRWLHIVSGVMWIGLLYYFNVVQTPGLAAAAADKGGPGGAGVSKYIAPRALVWFRWAAVATWLTGVGYLMSGYGMANGLERAFLLQPGFRTIGVGAWLGTIMLFNVWVFIWPNQ